MGFLKLLQRSQRGEKCRIDLHAKRQKNVIGSQKWIWVNGNWSEEFCLANCEPSAIISAPPKKLCLMNVSSQRCLCESSNLSCCWWPKIVINNCSLMTCAGGEKWRIGTRLWLILCTTLMRFVAFGGGKKELKIASIKFMINNVDFYAAVANSCVLLPLLWYLLFSWCNNAHAGLPKMAPSSPHRTRIIYPRSGTDLLPFSLTIPNWRGYIIYYKDIAFVIIDLRRGRYYWMRGLWIMRSIVNYLLCILAHLHSIDAYHLICAYVGHGILFFICCGVALVQRWWTESPWRRMRLQFIIGLSGLRLTDRSSHRAP